MTKVKMLTRHTDLSGRKLERGLIYSLPPDYAQELVNHGLAVLVIERPEPPEIGFVNVTLRPKIRRPKIVASEDEIPIIAQVGEKILSRKQKSVPEVVDD